MPELEPRLRALARNFVAALLVAWVAAGCSPRSEAPDPVAARVAAGEAELRAGRIERARAEFEAALAIDPGSPGAALGLGLADAAEGSLDSAVARFRAVTEADPERADAYLAWGGALLRQGRSAEALEKIHTALRLAPSAEGFQTLGMALIALGQMSPAAAAFERAEALGGELPTPVLLRWGAALVALGRLEEGRAKFERAVERAPDDIAALNNLGLLLVQTEGESGRGIALLERAVERQPDNPVSLHNLGWAYLRAERPEQALPLLERAMALTDPSDPSFERRRHSLEAARSSLDGAG